jgi:hypothetical protein
MSEEANVIVCLIDIYSQYVPNKTILRRHHYDLPTAEVLVQVSECKRKKKYVHYNSNYSLRNLVKYSKITLVLRALIIENNFNIQTHVAEFHNGILEILNVNSLNEKK